MKSTHEKLLGLGLYLIAIHSLIVGMLLIVLGSEAMSFFGFEKEKTFFQIQGGVFHIVMCVAYLIAALDVKANKGLILFVFAAKFIALLYLIIYYFMMEPIITLLLSAIIDGLMGLFVMIMAYRIHGNDLIKFNHGQVS